MMNIYQLKITIENLTQQSIELINLRTQIRNKIDNTTNSNPQCQIFKELWTSIDNSIKHINYSIQYYYDLKFLLEGQ